MPRKKPSKYKLHGWRRRTESAGHLVGRLRREFCVQPKPNQFGEEPHKKERH